MSGISKLINVALVYLYIYIYIIILYYIMDNIISYLNIYDVPIRSIIQNVAA